MRVLFLRGCVVVDGHRGAAAVTGEGRDDGREWPMGRPGVAVIGRE
ncbi:hypothetical protein [Streptomyces sp. E1N211]|nr:hypothetical protein [Streptomyces sp. E1N211]